MNEHDPSLIKEYWHYFTQNRGAVFGLGIVVFFSIVAILAPILAQVEPNRVFSDAYIRPPIWSSEGSTQFLLGTDDLGRDLLSRLIYGARISMSAGFLVVLFSLFIGTAIGLVAGYKGGLIDQAIMRCMDVLMALPSILLAIVVVAILGPNLFNAIVAVSFVKIPIFVRLVRSLVLVEKTKDYVVASKTFGASHYRQALFNILPNCSPAIIVQGTLEFSEGILNTAALGFLGLGAQPPTAEWGTMLSDTRAYFESAPTLVILPGLCILIVVLGFNLFGDGLRDALDPKLKR